MSRTICVVGCLAALGLGTTGCTMQTCTDMASVGPPVTVALVDDTGAPVVARGQVRHSGERDKTFDCSAAPASTTDDVDCQLGVLELEPLHNSTDTIALRFRLPDHSFTDWLPVDLTIRASTDPNANGPGCGATSYRGTAKPFTVPAGARLAAD